jgi:uncharacterized Zn-binding protein involved in type VI secretion
MPVAARGNGTDSVFSKTGSGKRCAKPTGTSTNECSPNVFINGIGAVRIGDKVMVHAAGGCSPDTSALTRASTKVFINSKGAGRIGDQYTSDNIITSGSPNVVFG